MKYILEKSFQGFLFGSLIPEEDILKWVKPKSLLKDALNVVTDEPIIYVGTPKMSPEVLKFPDSYPKKYVIYPTYATKEKLPNSLDCNLYTALYYLYKTPNYYSSFEEADTSKAFFFRNMALSFQFAQHPTFKNNIAMNKDFEEATSSISQKIIPYVIAYYNLYQEQASWGTAYEILTEDEGWEDRLPAVYNYTNMQNDYVAYKARLVEWGRVKTNYGTYYNIGVVQAEYNMSRIALLAMNSNLRNNEGTMVFVQKGDFIKVQANDDFGKNLLEDMAVTNLTGSKGTYSFFLNGLTDHTLFESLISELNSERGNE